jgi:hypothetical protein
MSIVAENQPSRQGYVSAVVLCPEGVAPSRAGEVQPAFFGEVELTESRPEWAAGRWLGTWLNVSLRYRKGAAVGYRVSAAVFVSRGGRVQRVYLRSCSCPDGLMRAGKPGEQRCCKHMIALRSTVQAQGVKPGSLLGGVWSQDQAQYAPEVLGY